MEIASTEVRECVDASVCVGQRHVFVFLCFAFKNLTRHLINGGFFKCITALNSFFPLSDSLSASVIEANNHHLAKSEGMIG